MLITKNIKVEVNRGNKGFLAKTFPNISMGDIIDVPALLFKGSEKKVKVCCDYCNKELEVTVKNYVVSTKKIDKYACKNPKCATAKKKELIDLGINKPEKKRKETNIKKYGVENPWQSEELMAKAKETMLERYGVEHSLQAESLKQKYTDTMIERYGVEKPMQSEEIKGRIEQTVFEKYGAKSIFGSKQIIDQIKQSNFEKYGVLNVSQLEEVKDKIKENNIKKYGVPHIYQAESFKRKSKKTNLKIYGTENATQSDSYRKDRFKITRDPNYIRYNKDNGNSIFNCDKGGDHVFEINSGQYTYRIGAKVSLCTVCNPIGDSTSIKQGELSDFIKSLTDEEVLDNYREHQKEIDIYVPHLKIGYEFNGLYWHSEKFKDKNYHQEKTDFFGEKGIKIIHIWEDEWDLRRDILKSQIRGHLNLSQRIFARKTEVKVVPKKQALQFLDDNHLQGSYSRVKEAMGLYHKDELVSVMTFDHQEGRKQMNPDEWNLSRFCNKKGISVVGGASRLLKNFSKLNSPKRIISYADADWSTGQLYEKLGFTKISRSRPDYKYVVGGIREHKSKWRKPKGEKRTEREIMQSLEIERIYDCGKIKYEKINTQNGKEKRN